MFLKTLLITDLKDVMKNKSNMTVNRLDSRNNDNL